MLPENFKELITNIFENVIPFNKFLGFKLMEIREGYAKVRIPFRPDFIGDPRTQRYHGGVISAAMDAVGGLAAITKLSGFEDKISTIDIRIDYMHGTRPEDMIIDAEILRSGNRIITTRMRAWHENDEEILVEGKGVYSVKRAQENK